MSWTGRLSEEEQALVAQCRMVGGLDTPTTKLVRKMGRLLDTYEAELGTRVRAAFLTGAIAALLLLALLAQRLL